MTYENHDCWRWFYWNLFGSILFQAGQDVTLVEKRHEIVEAIRKNGLKIIRGTDEKVLKIKITGNIEEATNQI